MTDPCDRNELVLDWGRIVDGLLGTVFLLTDPCSESKAADPLDGVRKRLRPLPTPPDDNSLRAVCGLAVPSKEKLVCLSIMGVA